MRDAQPVLMGVSPRWAELSQSGKPAWKSHSPTTRKKPELRTTWASPTVASAKPEPWCSDAVRPRLSSCWDVATGAHVCSRSRSRKRDGGWGRNEMFFLRLRSFEVLGHLVVRAVLVVDFTQGSSHTSC